MSTSTATPHVLVVTDEPGNPVSTRRLGFEEDTIAVSFVTTDGAIRKHLASTSTDCVVCATGGEDRCLDALSALRDAGDGVPVLVFADDPAAGFVTEVLEAGGTDIVQSELSETAPALVRRRLERLVGAGKRPTSDSRAGRGRGRERERQLYQGMVETIQDTAAVYDENGRFVVANDRLAALYDTTPDELRGERSHLVDVLGGRDDGQDPFEELVAGRRGEYRVELELDFPGEEDRITDVRLSRLTDEGEFVGVVAVGRDVSERKHRERKIARQRDELEQLDRLNAVIRDVDQGLIAATTREEIEEIACERLAEAGRYLFALALRVEGDGTLRPAAWTGIDREYLDAAFPDELTTETSPGLRAIETGETQVVRGVGADPDDPQWQDAVAEAGVEEIATVPAVYDGRSYGAIAVYTEGADAFSERELAVLAELGETVGYAIAAVERRERERTLTALYEASRDLLGTETEAEVCDVVVDVATAVLDLSEVGIFLFDDEENVLRPVSATETFIKFYGGVDTFGPGAGDSETWHAYVTGEPKVFDDITEADRVANPETDARSTLVYPLGEHGTFVAASTEVGVFDAQRRKLVGLLAATAETALDRVTGRASIRERERELADRTRRLERLTQVNDLARDIWGSLVRATARDEVEQVVSGRLAEEGNVAFAWIGTVPPDGESLVARTWAGDTGEYLDDVSLAVDGAEPAARTAASGTVTVVSDLTDQLLDHDWARTAADRGYQSVVAVPLAYSETNYGVLTAYATEPGAFDETADVLAELGELVAYGINSVETKRGVLADRVTELELRIRGPGSFMNAVADLADEPVRYLETTPQSGGRATVLFGLDDAPVEEILALETEFVGLDSLRHVGNGDRNLFRATVAGRTVTATLLDCGAVPDEVLARPEDTVAVVSLPGDRDVRVFVDRLRELYPETELVSRREGADRTDENLRGAVDSELTERQHEVLATAYESGFFQSPRETTGTELADLLGVSQPTVTHHLREAQRRLFSTLLGEFAARI